MLQSNNKTYNNTTTFSNPSTIFCLFGTIIRIKEALLSLVT